MRNLVIAAIAAIALVCPAYGQTVTPQSQSGTLTTITTDTVPLSILGTQWATARFKVVSAGTATATAQYSIDNGFNFVAAPLAKRLSTASANPTVQAISATTLTTGDIWEVPLPADATTFQLVCGGTGTTTSVVVFTGVPYVPGAPVTAVLFDVTSATNTALDTGTLNFSGWSIATAFFNTPAAGSGTITHLDDAGSALVAGGIVTVPASASVYVNFTQAPSLSGTGVAAGATGYFGPVSIQKRMRFQTAAVAAVTSRIRIEVRR